ncbi:lamin tail domain-containing protein, partial [Candidatus Babeliales bacterium]|nr:lamin tail domain-containing protein [Candidatus Babeliales bacterium]
YTVTAEDATDQIWTVTVTVASNDSKELTAFSIVDPSVNGVITELDHTVAVEVPYGTDVTALVATFATTGQEVKVGATVQVSGTTPNDFTSPVTYTVVAADASEQDYIVTVSITPGNTDATLSDLTVDGTTVTGFDAATLDYNVELPYGTTVEPVVAATTTDANANTDITQATDVEGDLAARTATVVVTAEDGTTTKTYTVVFSIEPNDDATLSDLTVDNGTLVPAFDAATYAYTVELPFGTTVEPVVAATKNDPNANDVITQATNVEGDLAARTATVVVTAEDGTTELTYDVIFTIGEEKHLFFSEYIEGDGGNNKALEIYNGTGADVDLHNYVIRINSNGSVWTSFFDFPVGTTLANDDVYVIAHSAAITEILEVTDSIVLDPYGGGTSYVAVFNGDDVRALCKVEGTDTTIIDIIGRYDQVDPGSGWDVAGVTNATQNHTLLRKQEITEGNADWDAAAGTNTDDSEWIVKDANYFDDLGSHGPKTGTDILTFSLAEQTGAATINATAHTVDIEVALATPVTALVATFTLSDSAAAKVGATDQVSATTPNDFTSPVTYTITAEDGVTIQDWTVTVINAPALLTENDILTYSFPEETGPATIDTSAHTVDIEVANGTNLTTLVATFTLSPLASAEVGGIPQVSGVTVNDFTSPVTYTIIAEDSTTQDWLITVTEYILSSETDILTYSFAEQTGPATIDTVTHTVEIEVVYGTDLTALVATFTLS